MGVFDNDVDVFTTFKGKIKFRNRLMAGIPADASTMEGWIRSKAGVTDEQEITKMMARHLRDMGVDLPEDATDEEVIAASEATAVEKAGCVFHRNGNGLYFESRKIKALIKESTHIIFGGSKWGKTKKGPKNYIAERAFIDPDVIPLNRDDADGTFLFIGHITDRQGPRSTLNYYEYLEQPEIEFTVRMLSEAKDIEKHWPEIWVHGQENGLGALRSQGFGRFNLVEWDKVS